MMRTVLVVHAHPEPTSLTRQLAEVAKTTLASAGHWVLESDLYGMQWKAVLDEADFPVRANESRLSFIDESAHAYSNGAQTQDVVAEQSKLETADAVIFVFPLWWFGLPAILKGWIDRVFAHGFGYDYRGAGNRYRYGDGCLAGKRALLAISVGAPAPHYSERGINGPLEQLLFPVTHGSLFFVGMDVLPVFAVYGAATADGDAVETAKQALEREVANLFETEPTPFLRQNGGAYPNGYELSLDVSPGVSGILAHLKAKQKI